MKIEWFESFVADTISKWDEFKTKINKDRPVLRNIEKAINELKESLASASNYDIGRRGEMFVKSIIENKKYGAMLSPGSKSPADVWSFSFLDDFFHLALIQVKTTDGKDQAPERLNEEKIKELELFCLFVYECLQNSTITPSIMDGVPVLVSVGYAGVAFNDNDEPSLYRAGRCFHVTYTRVLDQKWNEYERYILGFHRLA